MNVEANSDPALCMKWSNGDDAAGAELLERHLFGIANNVLRRHIRTRVNSRIVAAEVTARDLGPRPSTVLRVQREHRLLVEGTAENTVRNRLRRGRELLDAQLKACATSSTELANTMENLTRLLAER